MFLLNAHLSSLYPARESTIKATKATVILVYNAAELVSGLGIALLFSLWPVGSVHFIVSGLLPLSREASI